MRTVNADEAARLTEPKSEDGVFEVSVALPFCAEGPGDGDASFVGATFASSVDASCDIDVILVGCGGWIALSAVVEVPRAGEHDGGGTATSRDAEMCGSLT
jgi:hypothetical protein